MVHSVSSRGGVWMCIVQYEWIYYSYTRGARVYNCADLSTSVKFAGDVVQNMFI